MAEFTKEAQSTSQVQKIVSVLDQLWGILNNLVDFMDDMLPLNDGRVISAREELYKAQNNIGELLNKNNSDGTLQSSRAEVVKKCVICPQDYSNWCDTVNCLSSQEMKTILLKLIDYGKDIPIKIIEKLIMDKLST